MGKWKANNVSHYWNWLSLVPGQTILDGRSFSIEISTIGIGLSEQLAVKEDD